MNKRELKAYVGELRRTEDAYYRDVLGDPELYMLGIRLVRAIADSLQTLTSLEQLIARFRRTGSDYVGPIADSLNTPRVMFLDYHKALGAAFYLRAQELDEDQARSDWLRRVAQAGQDDAGWILVYDLDQQRYGRKFFQRLEMHLPDGISLRTWSDLDWEKGLIYVVEPLALDPLTGKPRADARLAEPSQEFGTLETMRAAAQALKEKLSQITVKPHGARHPPQTQNLSGLGQADAVVAGALRPKRRPASLRRDGDRRQQTRPGRSRPADRRGAKSGGQRPDNRRGGGGRRRRPASR
jgi:hypothetical protein